MGEKIIFFLRWLFCGGLLVVLNSMEKLDKESGNCSEKIIKKQRIARLIAFILWIIWGVLMFIKTIVGCL